MIYFILSCARSGSTSLAKIMDTAKNGACMCEPYPNLNIETRDAMDARLTKDDYSGMLKKLIHPRVMKYKDNNSIVYGEKNVTYGPFIRELYEMFDCKFIFLKRDGREVVRSLINWHNEKYGDIYLECKDAEKLSETAIKARAKYKNRLDTSDYSRPRPNISDPMHKGWLGLSRLEMCSWYWSYINNLYLDNLKDIPKDMWIEIDYSANANDKLLQIQRAFDFLGLRGPDGSKISNMLGNNINSLKYRGNSPGRCPDWDAWSESNKNDFNKIASDAMIRLGYYE